MLRTLANILLSDITVREANSNLTTPTSPTGLLDQFVESVDICQPQTVATSCNGTEDSTGCLLVSVQSADCLCKQFKCGVVLPSTINY